MTLLLLSPLLSAYNVPNRHQNLKKKNIYFWEEKSKAKKHNIRDMCQKYIVYMSQENQTYTAAETVYLQEPL